MKLKEMLSSKYYLRSFFSIILLMVLLMGLVAIFFWNTNVSRQRTDMDLEAQRSLARAQAQLSEKLDELLHIVLEIEADNSFTFSPVMGHTQAEKMIIQKTLDRYVSCNAFISDIAYESLLDEENIFSSRGRYSKEMYAKHVYNIDGFDVEGLARQAINTVPVWQLNVILNPTPKLAFIYSLPLLSSRPAALITFYIEKSAMDALFTGMLTAGYDNVYLLENDRLVYALHGQDEPDIALPADDSAVFLGADGMVYAQATTDMNGWHFIVRWDRAVLYREFYANRTFFALLLLSALLVIVLSSAMVALRNYAPLSLVLTKYRTLYESGTPPLRKDDLLALEAFVDDEIEKRQYLARQLFLSNLVWNQYEDVEAMYSAAEEAGIAFPYPSFVCCALLYEAEDGQAQAEEWLSQIEEALDTPHAICYGAQLLGQPMLYLLINMDTEHVDSAALEAAIADCLLHPGIRAASLGISETQPSPVYLSAQYQNASHAAHEGFLLGQPVTHFVHLELVGEHPQFLMAKRRIGEALRRANAERALAAWDALCEAVAQDEALSSRGRYVAYRLLDHLVNHFCDDLPETTRGSVNAYRTMLSEPSATADYAQAVRDLILLVAKAPGDGGETKVDVLLTRILQCIDAHYCDTDLSLERIATECRITSSYLVRYFKGKTGHTPMQYVDGRRMEHACRLLSETTLTLHEVTHASGYLNESNFARKFKKLYQCTPMNYRRQHSA